jgi:hypothetical protein
MSFGVRLEGFTEVKIYNMVWVKIMAPCGMVHGHKVFFFLGGGGRINFHKTSEDGKCGCPSTKLCNGITQMTAIWLCVELKVLEGIGLVNSLRDF